MAPGIDAALQSIVQIADELGRVRGTGFFVSAHGAVLTCHHVVDTENTLFAHTSDGRQLAARLDSEHSDPDHDLAVLQTGLDQVIPLPVVRPGGLRANTPFWTAGYHLQSPNVRGPLAEHGTFGARVHATYSARRSYNLSVISLLSPAWQPGLSGAPVLDPESGTVLAVITSRFQVPASTGGFAVPLDDDTHLQGGLKQILDDNRFSTPSYGAFLNAAGATIFCTRARENAIEDYRRISGFRQEWYVQRINAEVALQRSLEENDVSALVGVSGVGKSTLLAGFAGRAPGQALLLRASDANASDSDISDLANRALLNAGANLVAPASPRPCEDVSSALRAEGKQLILILDAVNELPATLEIQGWLERSLAFVTRVSAKWLLSCRPELWTQVSEVVCPNAPGATITGHQVVRLVEFDNAEQQQARVRYGVRSNEPYLRHPLMLRLRAEVGGPAVASSVDVLNAFLGVKVNAIGRRAACSSRYVASVLDRIVEASLRPLGLELTPAQLYAAAGNDVRIADALVDNYLLTATGVGVRFAFDELGEYLQGKAFLARLGGEIPSLADLLSHVHSKQVSSGAAAFVVLLGGDELAGAWLDAAIDWLITDGPEILHNRDGDLGAILHGVLTRVRLTHHWPTVLRLADFLVSRKLDEVNWHIGLEDFISVAEIGIEARLELARRLVQLENYYGWREKDWRDAPAGEQRGQVSGLGRAISDLIQVRSAEALGELTTWLSDRTALLGGEASVAEAAAMFLLWYTPLAPDVCDAIVRADSVVAPRLLKLLAHRYAELMDSKLDAWVSSRQSEFELAALSVLNQFESDGKLRERGALLLTRLAESAVDKRVANSALAALARVEPDHLEVADELVVRIARGDLAGGVWSLREALLRHFEYVIGQLRHVIEAGVSSDRLEEFIWFFGGLDEQPEDESATLDFLARCIELGGPEHALAAGHAIGQRILRAYERGHVPPRLRDMTFRALAQGLESTCDWIAWFGMHLARTDECLGFQRELVMRVDPAIIVAESFKNEKCELGKVLLAVRQRVTEEEFEELLFENVALRFGSASGKLLELLQSRVLPAPRYRLREWMSECEVHNTSSNAARDIRLRKRRNESG